MKTSSSPWVYLSRKTRGLSKAKSAALAFLKNKPQTQSQFEAAQRVMSLLIQGARSPSSEEGDFLRQSFNQADRHFGIQSGAMLVRAFEIVDQAGADGETADKKGSD